IQPHDLLEVDDLAPSTHLPEASDAGFGAEPPEVVRLVVLEIGLEERTRPNERHVAREHVPDLRQFVETPPPQEAAHSRYARIVRNLEQSRIARVVQSDKVRLLRLRTDAHRAEFVHPE